MPLIARTAYYYLEGPDCSRQTSVLVSLPAERKHKTLTVQFQGGTGVTVQPAVATIAANGSVELHITASISASLGLQAVTIRGKENNQDCTRPVLYYAFPTLWSGDQTNAEINNLVTQYGGVREVIAVVNRPQDIEDEEAMSFFGGSEGDVDESQG